MGMGIECCCQTLPSSPSSFSALSKLSSSSLATTSTLSSSSSSQVWKSRWQEEKMRIEKRGGGSAAVKHCVHHHHHLLWHHHHQYSSLSPPPSIIRIEEQGRKLLKKHFKNRHSYNNTWIISSIAISSADSALSSCDENVGQGHHWHHLLQCQWW